MGVILGSVALGVLFGYPAGGFLYDFVSESAPFIIIAFFLFTDLAFQLTFFDFSRSEVREPIIQSRNCVNIATRKIDFLFSAKSMARKIVEKTDPRRSGFN